MLVWLFCYDFDSQSWNSTACYVYIISNLMLVANSAVYIILAINMKVAILTHFTPAYTTVCWNSFIVIYTVTPKYSVVGDIFFSI